MELNEITEIAMTSPANHVPDFVAVRSVTMTLPFAELTWENFEKLCYRLAGKDADVESHSLYGRTGQAQQGIDIFARKRNGRYNSWQAKRYKKYTHNDLNSACATFLSGGWAGKTDIFYIAVQCPVDDVNLQDAIEKQAKNFRAQNIVLKVLGGHDLCTDLRDHPDIVLEFFGRECAKHFFGDTVSQDLLNKLDGGEIQKVRSQLLRVYQAGFELLDKIPVNAPTPFSDQPIEPISLLERFSAPDVLLRENVKNHAPEKKPAEKKALVHDLQSSETHPQSRSEESRQAEQYRRTPILNWLAESDQIAVIGHAGTGKSTVLRCLALDLLGDQNHFTNVAKKWGRHLPLFISFAKWVRLTEANGGVVSIKALIRETWQQQLTADLVALIDKAIDESRVVLFVDGLDEWANEQAARTTLQAMLTVVSAHSIPVLVSARPGGLTTIGGIPDNWAVGVLAPLSKRQQKQIATIWFSRNVDRHRSPVQSTESVLWQTNRFFDELNKGRGLSTLAETPLLLLGLIALAIRQLVLPINKVQALSQLTELLLERHPHSRATAAGDVVPRFSPAASNDVRREALAALAFKIRSEGGDAGYPIHLARKCIQTFLTDPEGFSYTQREAMEVANEILAVNSETMGLLVEKGRAEVGFVHASLEEYLASVHIHGWPIERILEFVRANASHFRWRSVFSDLIARNNRRSEAEKIVRVIDEPESDAVGALQRRLLLADVVFGGAEINKPTAIRLAEQSFNIITGSGWIGERSAHLAAAFEGVYNTTLREKTSTDISSWGTKSADYLHNFYHTLSKWPHSDETLNILQHAMKDENVYNARAAAHVLASKYAGNAGVEEWLVSFFRGDSELMIVGIALETLVLGWPKNGALPALISSAIASKDPHLRLSAIFCKVKLSIHDEQDLDVLLDLLCWYSRIDYHYRDLAGQCLILGWKDNESVIKICLDSFDNQLGRDEGIEKDIAQLYLTNCNANNTEVIAWILRELESKHPFLANFGQSWEWLLRFTDVNAAVREKVISSVLSEKMEHKEYMLNRVFSEIEDPRIKQHLINKVKTAEGNRVFWFLTPLLHKRKTGDHEMDCLVKEILHWPDDRKRHIVSLFPKMLGREECIEALMRIAKTTDGVRIDLLISAFTQLDVGSDTDITSFLVARFFSEPDNGYSGLDNLLQICPDEPRLKDYALSKLEERNPPLAMIAYTYYKLPEVRLKIAKHVGSLSVAMRHQIMNAAASEFDRNETAEKILSRYDDEVDSQLKIESAIKYYQALLPANVERQTVIDRLILDAQVAGPDFEERHAAAFAGLVAYGAVNEFVCLEWNKKPLTVSLGPYSREPKALLRLVAEHWDEIDVCFDKAFISRISDINSGNHFWSLISPYVGGSASLRDKFIAYCESSSQVLNIQALQSLARELPKSDLLQKHCLSAIQAFGEIKTHDTWSACQSYFEASYILREQFPGTSELTVKILKVLQDTDYRHGIAAMAIYDPYHSSLDNLVEKVFQEAESRSQFVTSIILASARSDSQQLGVIVKKMINRHDHNLWDFQDRINQALKFRMGNDAYFVTLMGEWLASTPTESEISSFSRYLTSSGKLDEDTQKLCRHYLNERYIASGIPAHGYDALSDLIRPVTHSLLDVLAGPIH
ncbi:Predicted NTPase (NACHT family) [Serratia fonticola]|uniref:NACHT domain-containing protein n=1 Tax=Serratia fonticola TaxID=47917 RepID=UPI002182A759|nr:NACHT domain-containing protein [Serratia fonticola]CAI2408888.1 Predicted NTPase (NACHT family) [Serratia fonticola]